MTFWDVGPALVAVYGIGLLGIGLASSIILARINSKWPPISLHEKSREAISAAAAGLSQFQAGAFTLHAAAADISTPARDAIAAAIRSYQDHNPGSGIQVTNISTQFDQQLVAVSFDFVFPVPNKSLVVRGKATGLAFVALNGGTLTLIPAIQRIKVTNVTGNLFWIFRPPVSLLQSLLDAFMANINGAIQPIQRKVPIAPFTSPGQPLNTVTASVDDPLTPGHSITVSVSAPILGASAILIDRSGIALMGDLRIADAASRPSTTPNLKTPTFAEYSAAFHTVATSSGIPFGEASSFEVSQNFVQSYFQRYLLSISAASIVDQAVQEGARDLANLGTATTGVRIKNQVITTAISSLIDAQMSSWRAKAPGSTVQPTQTKAGGQAINSTVGAHVVFQQGSIDGNLVAVGAPTGGVGQFTVHPAIGGITLSNVTIGDYTDLNGMLLGVNTILAGAAQAVNGQITPMVIPVTGLGLETINLQSTAPSGVTITPPSVTLPAAVLADAAVLIDDSEFKVMARFSTDAGAPGGAAPGHVTFDQYRQNFLGVWAGQMPDGGTSQSDASVFQTESSLAGYINQGWPGAGISVTTTMSDESRNTADLKLDLINMPSVSCNPPIQCNCNCQWWNAPCWAACGACQILNAGVVSACSLAKAGIDLQIAALNAIIGNLHGSFSSDIHASAAGGIYNLRLNLAPDFSRVNISGSAGATASVSMGWNLQPKDLGILVCVAPVGGNPSWSANGSIPTLPSFNSVIGPYSDGGRTGLDIGITSDSFTGAVTMPDPPLNHVLQDLTKISIDCPITMPVVQLLTLVDGFANIDRFALENLLHQGASNTVWSIIMGQFAETIPSMTYHLKVPPPQFSVGAMTLKGSLTQTTGWVRADFAVSP
jgi:hypothetical protein